VLILGQPEVLPLIPFENYGIGGVAASKTAGGQNLEVLSSYLLAKSCTFNNNYDVKYTFKSRRCSRFGAHQYAPERCAFGN